MITNQNRCSRCKSYNAIPDRIGLCIGCKRETHLSFYSDHVAELHWYELEQLQCAVLGCRQMTSGGAIHRSKLTGSYVAPVCAEHLSKFAELA